jgi:hypothetical protein
VTPAPWQGTRPLDRIRHSWRCTRTGARVETVRRLPTGDALVVLRCVECEADDLADRVREQARQERQP